jgi:hypothetical protein
VSDLELFHLDSPPPTPSEPKLSADRRRTLRQKADVARGVHPLMRTRTFPDVGACGDCAHRQPGSAHRWPKCDLVAVTHGPGTDCRAWWPACGRYEPGDHISDDAARWTPEHATRDGLAATEPDP